MATFTQAPLCTDWAMASSAAALRTASCRLVPYGVCSAMERRKLPRVRRPCVHPARSFHAGRLDHPSGQRFTYSSASFGGAQANQPSMIASRSAFSGTAFN
jgi:hypothetical protein